MENFIFCEEDRLEQNHSRSYYFTDPLREKKHKTLLKLKFWKVNFLASRYFPKYDAISLLWSKKINLSIERLVHRQISFFLSTISKLWNVCSKSQISLACLKLKRKNCDAETCYRSTFPEMLWISCSEKKLQQCAEKQLPWIPLCKTSNWKHLCIFIYILNTHSFDFKVQDLNTYLKFILNMSSKSSLETP